MTREKLTYVCPYAGTDRCAGITDGIHALATCVNKDEAFDFSKTNAFIVCPINRMNYDVNVEGSEDKLVQVSRYYYHPNYS